MTDRSLPILVTPTSWRWLLALAAALVLGLAVFVPSRGVQAANDCTWNKNNGNWADVNNWTGANCTDYPGHTGTTDTAVIPSGDVTLNANITIASLTLSTPGTMDTDNNSRSLTTGGLTWSSGSIDARQLLSLSATNLSVDGTAARSLNDTSLQVTGSTTWDSLAIGQITLIGSSLSLAGGGAGVDLPAPFSVNSTSSLSLTQGVFNLTGGISGSGALLIGPSTTGVDFSGGTYDLGRSTFSGGTATFGFASTLTSPGSPVTLNGGTLVLASGESQAIPSLVVSAGRLTGSDPLSATSLSWTGGTLACSGGITAGSLATSGAGPWGMDGGSLLVTGSTSWNGTGTVSLANSAGLSLSSGSVNSSGQTVFTGSGTVSLGSLAVSGPSSLDFIGGAEMRWSGGTLSGGGSVTIESSAALSFGLGPAWTINTLTLHVITAPAAWPSALTVSGGGTLDLQAAGLLPFSSLSLNGTLTGTASYAVDHLAWSGGAISGSGSLAVNTLDYQTSAARTLTGRTVNVFSTVTWPGSGLLTLGAGSALNFNTGAAVTTGALSLAGGSLGGSDTLVTGNLAWSAGTISAPGGMPSIQAASLTISGSGPWTLTHRSLTTPAGTTSWSGSSISPFSLTASSFTDLGGGTVGRPLMLDASSTLTFDGSASLTLDGGVSGSGSLVFGPTTGGTVSVSGPYSLTGGSTSLQHGSLAFNDTTAAPSPGSLSISGGTLSFNSTQPVSLPSLTLSGGTLGGSDPLTISGNLAWTGGTIQGSASLTTGSLSTSGNGVSWGLSGRSLSVTSATSWAGTGTFTLASSATLNLAGGGSTTWNGQTVFTGTGTVKFASLAVSPTSALEFISGAILNWTGGTFSGGGMITVENSAFLSFTGASGCTLGDITLNLKTNPTAWPTSLTISGGGTLNLTAAGIPDFSTLVLSGGMLAGTGNFDIATLTWSSGTFNGAGTTTITNAFNLNSPGPWSLMNRSLTATSISSWGSSTAAFSLSGSRLDLSVGSSDSPDLRNSFTLDASSTLAFTQGTFTLHGAVSGSGTLQVGSATTTPSVTFSDASYTFSQSTFRGGTATFDSTSTIGSLGDPVTVNGGSLSLNTGIIPPASITIANLALTSGILGGQNTINISGTLTWTGGTIGGAGSRPGIQAGTLSISGPGDWTLTNRTLTASSNSFSGSGTLNLDNADLTLAGGSPVAAAIGSPITLANSSRLAFNGGSFNLTGSISGGGAVVFGPSSPTTANFTGSYIYDLTGGASTFTSGIVTFDAGGSSLLPGSPVTVSGAAVVINMDSTLDPGSIFNLGSGSLGGSGNIQVGTFSWSGGSLVGSGSLTTSAFTFSAPIASTLSLNARSLSVTSPGSLSWTGSGTLNITNNGHLDLSTGSDQSIGNLRLTSGGILSGSDVLTTLSGSTLTWTDGTILASHLNVPASLTLDGSGTRMLSGGVLDLSGPAAWSGSGSLSLGASSVLAIQNGSTFNWNGSGTLSLAKDASTPAALNIDSGGSLALNGTGGQSIQTNGSGLLNPSLSNSGSLVVDQGIYSATIELPVNNSGAIQLKSGTLTLNGDLAGGGTGTLNVQGGVLSGTGNLTGLASLAWSAGTISAPGGMPSIQAASLTISGSGPWTLTHRSLTTPAGTTSWSGSSISPFSLTASSFTDLGGGTVGRPLMLDASSTLTFDGSASLTLDGGVSGSGSLVFGPTTGGTVSVSGPYSLTGGSTSLQHGSLAFNDTTAAPSPGSLSISGGTLSFNSTQPVSLPSLTLSGGTLGGSDPLTISGNLAWTGGTISGSGAISGPGSLIVSTGSPKVLSGRSLALSGLTSWSGNGLFTLNQAALTLQGSDPTPISIGSAISASTADSQLTFASGTYHLEGNITGPGSVTFGTPGNPVTADICGSCSYAIGNTSTFRLGTVTFNNGSSASLGSAVLSGGTLMLSSGKTVSAASLEVSSGQLSGTDNVIVSGMLTWLGGDLVSTAATAPYLSATGLTFTATGMTTVQTRSLLINGPVYWSGLGSVSINPSATLDLSGYGTTVNIAGGISVAGGTLTGTDSLNVAGTLDWSSGMISGTGSLIVGTLTTSGTGPRLLDGHTLQATTTDWGGTGLLNMANSSTLDITGGGSFTGGPTTFSGSGVVKLSSLTVSGPSSLDFIGGAEMRWSGGTLSGGGSVTIESSAALSFGLGPAWTINTLTLHVITAPAAWPSALTVSGGGTLDVQAASIPPLNSLALAGTLTGVGDLTVNDLAWSAGTISGTGRLTVPTSLSLPGAGQRSLDTRRLVVAGTLSWTGAGSLHLNNAAILDNQGQMTLQGSGSQVVDTQTVGAPGQLINSGVLVVQQGAGTVEIAQVDFTSTGPMQVASGTLTLNPASLAILNGPVAVDGILKISYGAFTLGISSRMTGSGTVQFSPTAESGVDGIYDFNGITTFNSISTITFHHPVASLGSQVILAGGTVRLDTGQPVTIASLDLRLGELGGSDDVTITGLFQWSGGRLSAPPQNPPASLTLPPGAAFQYLDASYRLLDSRVLNISCPTTWSGRGTLNIKDNGQLINDTSGVMTIQQADASMLLSGISPAAFTNRGTLILQNGAGTNAILNAPVANTGTIDLQGGTLNIYQGYTQTGGLLQLSGGSLTIGNPSQQTGQTLSIDGGRLRALGTSTITGNLVNNGGTIDLGDLGSARLPGYLIVTGDFSQGAAGELAISLLDSAHADQIEVGGKAMLDGTLRLAPHYAPAQGDRVNLVHHSSRAGSFSSLAGNNLGGDLSWLPDDSTPGWFSVLAAATPADLSIMLSDGRSGLVPGMAVAYTLTVTNNDPAKPALGAVVSAAMPAGLEGVSWSCAGPGTTCRSPSSGSGDVSQVLDLPAGGSAVITIHAVVSANASGTIIYTARLAFAGVMKTAADEDVVLPAGLPGIFLPFVVR